MWIQRRMAYATQYEALIQMDGETQNILSAIRRSFLLEDPYQGSTIEQDQAYIDIERLTCNSMKDIFNYLNDYKMLAAKSVRMFTSPKLYFVIDYVRKQNHLEITQIIQESSKEQRRLQQAVLQLQKELVQNKPLTSSDIKGLVVEITKQPKLIEEQAVVLIEELRRQIKRIEEIMHEVKRQVNARVNALIVLRDTRWRDDRSVIVTMTGLSLLISVEDFFHHIKLAIQTHGYEDWNMAESNLLITRGLIGRLTNTSHAGFRYNVQNIADYLASTGIHAGYQSAKNSQPRRLSNLDIEEIRNEGEEEFAGVFTSEYALPLFHEEYGYPDTNNRWDTLGEPSGKYNYYVNYAAPPPQPFIPATRPSWGDEDNTDDEAIFPSIWEDTPWEEDPNDLAPANEDEEDLESYFLGLSNLETDYPVISSNSVLPDDNQQLPLYWDNSDTESEEYLQVVEEVEEQFYATQTNNLTEKMNKLSVQEETSSTEGEPNDSYHNQDQGSSQNIQSTEEAAHVGTDSLLTEQLERMDYPILRSMIQRFIRDFLAAKMNSRLVDG
ncbi:hypothetical protein ZIOFF_050361 [Zingiber officinale]|uniref:Uncharacterized protein n=1 Tax=Zingiber officinale TaxID=94328 RepID=A0A8J5FK49_ZINOF|nr:hypothetical protein ZIOFF_050361 [Zingiber officinale]